MKNTTENNKLLAEFMGVKKELFWFNLKTGNYVKKENTYCEIEQVSLYVKNNKPITSFLYHSDWNWLMQVVEKIESLGYNIDTMKYQSSQFCGIYRDGKIIYTNYCETKIEAVYNACIEFVKWYNKNNK